MRIGIITVHRALNYGSVLQCYALQEFLKKLGHDVWVIDYRQRWVDCVDKVFSPYFVWHYLRKWDLHAIVGHWRSRESRRKFIKRVDCVFGSFVRRFNLTRSCRYSMPKGFDVYLIGSDQLWSHQCVGGEDKFFLGNFKHSSKSRIIGYALSVSTVSLDIFGKNKLKKIISNFDSLTLREQLNSDIIYNMTEIRLPVVVDPVLLTDESFWKSMVNDVWSKKTYIAVYQVRYLSGKEKVINEKAKLLAEKMDCEIIDLSYKTYSVEDFISIIKYAKCVITSSFHAVVFSLIMKTPCYAVKLNDGLDVRYVDLLTKVGLEQELVDIDFEPHKLDIDFNGIEEKIDLYRKESVEFLKSI